MNPSREKNPGSRVPNQPSQAGSRSALGGGTGPLWDHAKNQTGSDGQRVRLKKPIVHIPGSLQGAGRWPGRTDGPTVVPSDRPVSGCQNPLRSRQPLPTPTSRSNRRFTAKHNSWIISSITILKKDPLSGSGTGISGYFVWKGFEFFAKNDRQYQHWRP